MRFVTKRTDSMPQCAARTTQAIGGRNRRWRGAAVQPGTRGGVAGVDGASGRRSGKASGNANATRQPHWQAVPSPQHGQRCGCSRAVAAAGDARCSWQCDVDAVAAPLSGPVAGTWAATGGATVPLRINTSASSQRSGSGNGENPGREKRAMTVAVYPIVERAATRMR